MSNTQSPQQPQADSLSTLKNPNAATDATLPSSHVLSTSDEIPAFQKDRYRIDESDENTLLGRGGQGAVWRAYDVVLRREVAIKKLHTAASNPKLLSEIVREARLTAALEHPGIVPLHDIGKDADGAVFLALRRIEGNSLAASLAQKNTLEWRLSFVPALVRACQAVAFANERGVVHRDLKPQNIMLGPFGETYVLDWGLALVDVRVKNSPDMTAGENRSSVVGTPACMSPEQALGFEADLRSDVWGMGACLYQLLTGQPPIQGSSIESAVNRAATAQLHRVIDLEPNAPVDLAAICEKACSQERTSRYENATALARDLEQWLAGRTVSARSYTKIELLVRAVKANARVLAFVSIGLISILTVTVANEWRVRRERNDARAFSIQLIRNLETLLPKQASSVELVNSMTKQTQNWLQSTTLSNDELVHVCFALNSLGAMNTDIADYKKAKELFLQANELATRGNQINPNNIEFTLCEVNANSSLGYVEIESGQEKAGLELYRLAWARLEKWTGAQTPQLRMAKSQLAVRWGDWAWDHDIEKAKELFILSAQSVDDLLDEKNANLRRPAFATGPNAVNALWAQGRREQAAKLAKRFADAAATDCLEQTLEAQRGCWMVMQSHATQAAWANDPNTSQLQSLARAADTFVRARDADSPSILHDSMILYFEQGLFVEAAKRAKILRETNNPWAIETAPLVAALAGDLNEVDAWTPLLKEAHTGGLLALAIHEMARSHFAMAAKYLREIDTSRLWYDISWPPHPHVQIQVPPSAATAFTHFVEEFSLAYGAADMKHVDSSVKTFATALEQL
jgi:serine/threonine protein kinase